MTQGASSSGTQRPTPRRTPMNKFRSQVHKARFDYSIVTRKFIKEKGFVLKNDEFPSC